MKLNVVDCGSMEYGPAWDLQKELVEKRREGLIPDTLLLVEHPPVITMGRRAGEADILKTADFLKQAGVGVFTIERGGEATYHGPGQIVGYTIIDLREHFDIREFIDKLEEVFIGLLDEEFSIKAERVPEHRGVWVGNEKITAIGIAIKRRVTMHGFAFNVNTDLSPFTWIVPCGITDRGVTSLEKLLKRTLDLEMIEELVVRYFSAVFGYDEVTRTAWGKEFHLSKHHLSKGEHHES